MRNAASPGAGYYYGGLNFTYNSAAQLGGATADIVDANHPQSILAALNYTPLGGVSTAELGAQYGQVSQYDKRGRMTNRYSINLAGFTVLADQWEFDPAGNVKHAIDSAQGDFQYTYDNLNRVTKAVIPPFTEAYSYDPWGNQTARTLSAGTGFQWNYTPTTSNQATGSGMTYDAAGNMLTDGQHSYSYDAESRVAAVTDQGVTYRYDPEGKRVATVSGSAVTAEYLYDMAGSLVTTVNGQGQMVRTILRDNGGTHWGDSVGSAASGGVRTEFRLVNQVGTLVANGDTQGNFVEGCLSGPFGDGQDCTPTYDFSETHFADKLRDSETDNDYFGARYFNSTMGRWLSPDYSESGDVPDSVPYADFTNPQSLTLYSYLQNNPLFDADEDGHQSNESVVCDSFLCSALQGIKNFFRGSGGGSSTNSGPQVGDMPLDPGAAAMVRGVGHDANTILPLMAGGAIVAAFEVAPMAAPGTGAAMSNLRTFSGLLPAVPSAVTKLQKINVSLQRAREIVKSEVGYADNNYPGMFGTGININYIANEGGRMIRITTDAAGTKIISAGRVAENFVARGLASGRLTPR